MYLVCGKYLPTNKELKEIAHRYDVARCLFSMTQLTEIYRVYESEPAKFEDYQLVHPKAYVDTLREIAAKKGTYEGEAIEFERVGVGGSLIATCLGLSERCTAYHLGGGYHHGMPDRPNSADYCNDVAIALAHILATGVEKILYVDLDVHHPDGVQKIFESEPRILQISLHGWAGRYTNEGHYSFIGTDAGVGRKINMPLPPHTGDRIYLQLLRALLTSVMRSYQPEVVFYQAGVDSYRQDPIGCLNLSLRGLYERDKLVASICVNKPMPFVVVLGGGYDPKNAPRAVINTLSAIAGKKIVFDEPESLGSTSALRALLWYDKLRTLLRPYVELEKLVRDERKEDGHA